MTKAGHCSQVVSCVAYFLVCWHVVVAPDIPLSKERALIRLKRQFEDVPEAEPGNANEFFDDLLTNARQFVVEKGLEPLQIGQVEICSDCILAGLRTIKRTGDATLMQDKEDVVFDVNIGFDLIRGSCYCIKRLLILSIRGHIRFILKNIAVRTKLRVQINPEIKPKVETFEVKDNGQLDLYWEGRGFLGNAVQPLFLLFRHKISRIIQRFLPALLKTAINNNIDRFTSFINF